VSLRYSADRSDVHQTVVTIGFVTAGPASSDWAALDVLGAILGRGRASRLSRALVTDQMLAFRVESELDPLRQSGLLSIQLRIAPGSIAESTIDKAEATLFKETDRIRRETIDEAELARAKNLLIQRSIDSSCEYIDRALSISRAEVDQGGFRSAAANEAGIR